MSKVESDRNGSKQPPSEPRAKAAPKITEPTNEEAERVVLRHGEGRSMGVDATIGDLLPRLFSNEFEYTGQPFAEEALRSLADELFLVAHVVDPNDPRVDIYMVREQIYRAIMRLRDRAEAAADLSAKMRDAELAKAVAS